MPTAYQQQAANELARVQAESLSDFYKATSTPSADAFEADPRIQAMNQGSEGMWDQALFDRIKNEYDSAGNQDQQATYLKNQAIAKAQAAVDFGVQHPDGIDGGGWLGSFMEHVFPAVVGAIMTAGAGSAIMGAGEAAGGLGAAAGDIGGDVAAGLTEGGAGAGAIEGTTALGADAGLSAAAGMPVVTIPGSVGAAAGGGLGAAFVPAAVGAGLIASGMGHGGSGTSDPNDPNIPSGNIVQVPRPPVPPTSGIPAAAVGAGVVGAGLGLTGGGPELPPTPPGNVVTVPRPPTPPISTIPAPVPIGTLSPGNITPPPPVTAQPLPGVTSPGGVPHTPTIPGIGSPSGGGLGSLIPALNDRRNSIEDTAYWKSQLDRLDHQAGLNTASNAGYVSNINGRAATADSNDDSYMNTLLGMYAPGSPEATLMQQQMDAKDAAAGRNSQYGVRAMNLAGMLAQQRGQLMTSPGYVSARDHTQGSNLLTNSNYINAMNNKSATDIYTNPIYNNMQNAYRDRGDQTNNSLLAALGNMGGLSGLLGNITNLGSTISSGLSSLFGSGS